MCRREFAIDVRNFCFAFCSTFRATDATNDAAVNVMPAYFLSTHVYYLCVVEVVEFACFMLMGSPFVLLLPQSTSKKQINFAASKVKKN